MVKKCPEHTNDDYARLCENINGAPVVFQGARFYNVFCAACHGIPQEEIEIFQLVVYEDDHAIHKTVFLSTENAPISISKFYLNTVQNSCETWYIGGRL